MASQSGSSSKPKTTEYNINRKIFVGNISYRIKSRKLTKFFSKFGPVEYCYIVKDHIKKWSKGFAFITFKDEESMQRALRASEDELFFDQRYMRVKEAELSTRATYWEQPDNSDSDDNDDGENDAVLAGTSRATAMDHQFSEHNVSEDTGCPIDRLIDDVLIHIFTMLSWKERIGVERVCRRWQQLMKKSWSTTPIHLQFSGVFRQFQGLTDKMLNSLLKRCGQYVQSIDLSGSPRSLTDFAMDIIGKYSPDVENLDVSRVKITDKSIQNLVNKCHKLKNVKLQACAHVSDKGVNTLLNSGQPLVTLDLSDMRHLSGRGFKHLDNNIATLKHLTLTNCMLISDDGCISLLKHSPNIEKLMLTECYNLSHKTLRYICQNCHHLRVLHYDRVQVHGDMLLSNLKQLESLDISRSSTVDDRVLVTVAENCRHLRHLNISECCAVSDVGVMAVARLPNLESINITAVTQLTEASIKSLAEGGNLVKFVAQASKAVTDDGISLLVALCPRLCYIDLSGCFKVTNKIFESFKNALSSDPEKTVDLKLGGTSVDWLAEDVNWMSGFSHLNVSMQNNALGGLLAYQDIIMPSPDEEDWDLDDVPQYEAVVPEPMGDEHDAWSEDSEDGFLDNDDPLEYERWNMS